jgi:hypothetical protein
VLRLTIALSLALLATAPAASARPFFVGVNDDTMKWSEDPGAIAAIGSDLGLGGFRITLPWQPGKRALSATDRTAFDRIAATFPRPRVVLTAMGVGRHAPSTATRRSQYCTFVRDALARYPFIRDVVIWNEANKSHFWLPQFTGGTSVAPAAYARLLAECYDVLHRFRPNVNVISSTSPRMVKGGHSPQQFLTEIGRAYRALKRTRPLVDTFGHNVYPLYPSEPLTFRHTGGTIGLGDYGKLTATLQRAFAGTRQPLPSPLRPRIWYLETGFQTAIAEDKLSLYEGTETELRPLTTAAQGRQLAAAVRTAACQQGVGAIFNFMLADESRLLGWQSGLLWADWTPKPAYEQAKLAIAKARGGACA